MANPYEEDREMKDLKDDIDIPAWHRPQPSNNLIMELEKTHKGGVGVGALQGCEPDSECAGCVVTIFLDYLQANRRGNVWIFIDTKRYKLKRIP
ncbi:hypothetical protein F2Q70_00043109 [Brassica cretica]|uniref:Uncharacterized protein n=1 Tax=Brassica cretica TaxID=69181 RepID=A0A8S9KFE3_BRACR|nr:hypothetical protein F2Q70_00043109 [Brassica cretica]